MTINFPATPTTGTTHAHNGKVWKWDGTSWTGGVLSSYTVVGDGLNNIVEDTTPELGGTLDMGNNIIVANGGGITNTSIGQNYGYFPSEFGHYGGTTTNGWTFQNTGVGVCRADGPNSNGTSINALQIGNFNNLSCLTITGDGALTTNNTISDAGGNVRSLPVNTQAAAYTIQTSDTGKMVKASGDITISSANQLSEGDVVTIYNATAGNINLTRSGTDLYLVGDNTNQDRVLATRGVATIMCVGTNEYVIMGGGIT
jgi:hypothetical protein|tara:strand:+ start:65 stop:835 length:771 start_codon:yes stop_codon:yes gene_type:complete